MKVVKAWGITAVCLAGLLSASSSFASPIVQQFDLPITSNVNLDFDLAGGADHRIYDLSGNRTFGDIGFSQTTGSFNSWRGNAASTVNYPSECCSIGVVFANGAGTGGAIFSNNPGLSNSAFLYIPVITGGYRGFAEFVIGNGGVAYLARSGMIENSAGTVLSPETVGLPEPSSLALLAVGGLTMLRRKR